MGAWNCFQRAIIDEGDTNKCWKAWASFTWRPDSSCCRWICMCYLKLLNIVSVTEFHIWCFILLWLFLFLRNHVSESCLTNFSIRQAIWLHVNSLQRIFALDILEWEIYLCSQHFIFLCYILKLLDFLGVNNHEKQLTIFQILLATEPKLQRFFCISIFHFSQCFCSAGSFYPIMWLFSRFWFLMNRWFIMNTYLGYFWHVSRSLANLKFAWKLYRFCVTRYVHFWWLHFVPMLR